ncbi:hypothetical protein A3V60_19500 [Salmonella enterica subsp. enterica serovar Enteritidis]|nr:hypothetical protein [Salmonella enterica subsp. enterica serovar Enteritidis]ECC9068131.1 hypothetical protein [Salmonella enterica subsp. diarizonae]ECY5113601.1 hypothetical protein [Salmonella enterica subsp. enterica serovar Typhimurium]ECZ9369297.1 hypothetical protein [Salmonella enterica subsp. enterica serovar Enteritidis]EDF0513581.1 hypothetical protein [Salmonella enterica subsp. enterica serovar Enteritidis]
MPISQLHILLYVVSLPCSVTARSAPEKGGVVIPSPCYTSGKLLYGRKSDQEETGKGNLPAWLYERKSSGQ